MVSVLRRHSAPKHAGAGASPCASSAAPWIASLATGTSSNEHPPTSTLHATSPGALTPPSYCVLGCSAMYLGIVKGTVIAERKASGLEGTKLLLVQPVDEHGAPVGDVQAAVDR